MSAARTIHRITDTRQQQVETYRYWQTQSIGARLTAVWEVSEAAYEFAAAFRGASPNDAERPERVITRIQPTTR